MVTGLLIAFCFIVEICTAQRQTFHYNLGDFDRCEHESPDILLWVQGRANSADQRFMIRQAYGSSASWPDGIKPMILFFTGVVTEEIFETQSLLEYEFEQYGDIVQKDFNEHYRNQTLKLIAAIEFISTYCSKVPLILKLDDDVLFYPAVMLPILIDVFLSRSNLADSGSLHHKVHALPSNAIACHLLTNYEIWRISDHPNSAYTVDATVLPGEKLFPPFCAGYFVAMTGDSPGKLGRYLGSNKPFWIDDRYMGVLQKQANSSNINIQSRLSFGYSKITSSVMDSIARGYMLALHLAKAKSHLLSFYNYIDIIKTTGVRENFTIF